MNLFVLLLIGIIQFSEEKPTTVPETTVTTVSAENETSIVTEFVFALEPGDEAKTVSLAEKAVKNSSEVDEPPKEDEISVNIFSDDILLDPSLILARAERSLGGLESGEFSEQIGEDSLNIDRFNSIQDENPTIYFLRLVRVTRSAVEPDETELFKTPEETDKTVRRLSRSAEDEEAEDLDGADDGFIVRPLFKYRHEQLKRSNPRKGYRNRDSYYYYPRYPVFPG